MSELDIEPIKERLAAATPGPLGFATAPAEDSSESPAEYIANALTGYGEMYVVWDTSTEGDPDGYVLTAVTGDGPHASANAKLYAHAPSDLAALITEVERLRESVRKFSDDLLFGDGITEPAATLNDMVDPIRDAFEAQHDHIECPIICELCGEKLADKTCEGVIMDFSKFEELVADAVESVVSTFNREQLINFVTDGLRDE